MQIVRQVVDGRDVSASVSDATRKMQQAMEHMPPEQRARVEAMFRQSGVAMGANGYRSLPGSRAVPKLGQWEQVPAYIQMALWCAICATIISSRP